LALRSAERPRLICDSSLQMILTRNNEGRDYTEVGSRLDAKAPVNDRFASRLYRGAATQFAPTPDNSFWLRRTGGVVDTTHFRAEIARTMDTRMAERIADAAKLLERLELLARGFE
jgi:hypothetical protein